MKSIRAKIRKNLHSSIRNLFSAESRKFIYKTELSYRTSTVIALQTCLILTRFWFIKITMKHWQGKLPRSNSIKHGRTGKRERTLH